MRLTDIVETGLADCLNDPEARYEEMDSRARAAVDAGMGVVLDLSFIRDAAIRDGLNPYRADFDWEPYITSLLTRPFPAGGAYGTSEHVVYISLPGEPRVDWGDDPNQRAETAEDLIAFYQRLPGRCGASAWIVPWRRGLHPPHRGRQRHRCRSGHHGRVQPRRDRRVHDPRL